MATLGAPQKKKSINPPLAEKKEKRRQQLQHTSLALLPTSKKKRGGKRNCQSSHTRREKAKRETDGIAKSTGHFVSPTSSPVSIPPPKKGKSGDPTHQPLPPLKASLEKNQQEQRWGTGRALERNEESSQSQAVLFKKMKKIPE
eukprot:m.142651 g.142651  ORF g.142651 m.142651 type:complete len:144 (+) comp13196_c3_seq1:244-675(+)